MSGAMQANEQETANPGKRDEVPSESECSKGNATEDGLVRAGIVGANGTAQNIRGGKMKRTCVPWEQPEVRVSG